MEARTVWHTWRRVLREPPLQLAMFDGVLADHASALDLTPAQMEIAEQYAQAPEGTRFFIENYRFRLRSAFVNALETTAPLTHRLLRAHKTDVDALATEFLDSVRWRDFGPYVYTHGDRILDHLAGRPELTALPGMPELTALERAGIGLTVRAAAEEEEAEEQAPASTTAPTGAYRADPRTEPVHCSKDLSPWLRSGASVGRTTPPERPSWYLVQLRPPEWDRRIVAVPRRAADMVRALRTPRLPAELAAALAERGHPADPALDERLLGQLVRLGVVHPCSGDA